MALSVGTILSFISRYPACSSSLHCIDAFRSSRAYPPAIPPFHHSTLFHRGHRTSRRPQIVTCVHNLSTISLSPRLSGGLEAKRPPPPSINPPLERVRFVRCSPNSNAVCQCEWHSPGTHRTGWVLDACTPTHSHQGAAPRRQQ